MDLTLDLRNEDLSSVDEVISKIDKILKFSDSLKLIVYLNKFILKINIFNNINNKYTSQLIIYDYYHEIVHKTKYESFFEIDDIGNIFGSNESCYLELYNEKKFILEKTYENLRQLFRIIENLVFE